VFVAVFVGFKCRSWSRSQKGSEHRKNNKKFQLLSREVP